MFCDFSAMSRKKQRNFKNVRRVPLLACPAVRFRNPRSREGVDARTPESLLVARFKTPVRATPVPACAGNI